MGRNAARFERLKAYVIARAEKVRKEHGRELSDMVIAFCNNLTVPSGKGRGEPLVLRDWQEALIVCTIQPLNDDETRMIRRALWSMARKNGKTALSAALLLCALVGPLSVINGEVYSAASDRVQAGIVYKMASQMVKLDPELNAICKCLDTGKRIVCYTNGSFYQALAADAHRQHGANPHFVIYDELAQAKDRELYDVLSTSFDAQENALLLVISTQSSDANSIMAELADDAILQEQGLLDDPYFFGIVFRVDLEPDDERLFDEDYWYSANPGLGDFKLLVGMRSQATKAERSPSAKAAFLNLHLNLRVDNTAAFVNSEDWKACGGVIPDSELAGIEAFGGLDLSSKRDLCSLELIFPVGDFIAVKSFFWTPKAQLADRSKQDGAQYPVWSEKGFLRAVEGSVVDLAIVAEDIAAIHKRFPIKIMAYDRWRADILQKEFSNLDLNIAIQPHGQGFKDMGVAIDDLEESVLKHKLRHSNNPVLTYCMSNIRVTRDPAENRKFDKRARNKRIDGGVALAMAHSAMNRPIDIEEKPESVYEKRGVLVF